MIETFDLLLDFDELDALLNDCPDPLDAFLLAAGMSQITEDYLHRDLLALGKAADRVPNAAPHALLAIRTGLHACARARRVRRWGDELSRYLDTLAACIANGTVPQQLVCPQHRALPKRLRREVQRLPNCFRSFDQQPGDCALLVEKFAQRSPDRTRRVLVVGVRTSGSYLAPLVVAYLRRAGFEAVDWLTFRPGQRIPRRRVSRRDPLPGMGGRRAAVPCGRRARAHDRGLHRQARTCPARRPRPDPAAHRPRRGLADHRLTVGAMLGPAAARGTAVRLSCGQAHRPGARAVRDRRQAADPIVRRRAQGRFRG